MTERRRARTDGDPATAAPQQRCRCSPRGGRRFDPQAASTLSSGSKTVTASADGTASATLAVSEEGTYVVTASGTDEAGDAWADTATVEVTEADTGNGGEGTGGGAAGEELPKTGGSASTARLAQVGLAALAIGALAVFASRRRSRSEG